MVRLCSIDDCLRPHEARGFCAMHYQRLRSHGDALWVPLPSRYDQSDERSIDTQRSAAYRERHPGIGKENSARWRTRHPEGKAEYHRLKRYALTAQEYRTMVEAQDGRCAICRADSPGHATKWPVDHDHACCPGKVSCGKCVRGLLCHRCNRRLEAVEDPAFLKAARAYLDQGGWK